MNGKIYVIRNKINDKVYIGQTTMTVQSRFQHHLSSKPESHHYQAILCAIRKHGKENFWVETLVEGIETHEELDRLEEKYIAEFNSMKPNGRSGVIVRGQTSNQTKALFRIIYLECQRVPLPKSMDAAPKRLGIMWKRQGISLGRTTTNIALTPLHLPRSA